MNECTPPVCGPAGGPHCDEGGVQLAEYYQGIAAQAEFESKI